MKAKPAIAAVTRQASEDPCTYVDLAIGTGGYAHCFPAATVPFGAMQLGPDTGDRDWDHCSGYHLKDAAILGFSHTHLSGTGVGDMQDFRLMPSLYREPNAQISAEDFTLPFSHEDEQAEPGHYSVQFQQPSIRVELTATERAGFHRYTFPERDAWPYRAFEAGIQNRGRKKTECQYMTCSWTARHSTPYLCQLMKSSADNAPFR